MAPEQILEAKRIFLENERYFATKVYAALVDAAATQSEVIALFDVDETIGSPEVYEDRVETKLRPSLILVFERIRDARGKIGFISSRGKEAILTQLQEPHNLEPIAKYIDKSLVYSSHNEVGDEDSQRFIKVIKKKYVEGGIVNSAIVDSVDPYELPTTVGDQKKFAVLRNIKTEHSDQSIIVVDDARYPKFLSRANKLFGVILTHEEGMFVRPHL